MMMMAWSMSSRTRHSANCRRRISSTISGPGRHLRLRRRHLARHPLLWPGHGPALMNDDDFAAECADWLKRGKAAYQDKLWTGEYYRLWHDPANTSGEGPDCDVSLGNQLMAQWCINNHRFARRFAGRSTSSPALGAVKRLNMAATNTVS